MKSLKGSWCVVLMNIRRDAAADYSMSMNGRSSDHKTSHE